jgi:hypothetical protein
MGCICTRYVKLQLRDTATLMRLHLGCTVHLHLRGILHLKYQVQLHHRGTATSTRYIYVHLQGTGTVQLNLRGTAELTYSRYIYTYDYICNCEVHLHL